MFAISTVKEGLTVIEINVLEVRNVMKGMLNHYINVVLEEKVKRK